MSNPQGEKQAQTLVGAQAPAFLCDEIIVCNLP